MATRVANVGWVGPPGGQYFLVVVSKVNWKKILVVVSKVNWMKILVVVSKVNLVFFSHFRNSRSGREPNLFPILG